MAWLRRGGGSRGPGFKPFFQNFRAAFPDIQVVVEDTVSEGDKVAARCTVRGKHQSDTLGFAATHQSMEITGICIVRTRDGKIVEAWNNFDFMSMFKQLGALRNVGNFYRNTLITNAGAVALHSPGSIGIVSSPAQSIMRCNC